MRKQDLISELISKEIKTCSVKLKTVRNKLKNNNSEKLHIRLHRKKNYFFTVYKDENGVRKERYIRRNDADSLKPLSEKMYLSGLESVLKKEIEALKFFSEKYHPEAKYLEWDNLPIECKELVSPVFVPKAQYIADWRSEYYVKNTYSFASPGQFISKNGEQVRSKNELITANILYEYEVPYRYECELQLADRSVFPDFTVLHPETLDEWYIEFFGMMDDPEYAESAFKKIQHYYRAGYQSRLIMLFDSSFAPIPNTLIEKLIKETFT